MFLVYLETGLCKIERIYWIHPEYYIKNCISQNLYIISIYFSISFSYIMKQEDSIILFSQKEVRRHWDEEQELWFFSVVDVIEILTESPRPRKYWNALKTKLLKEGSQLSQSIGQLKMKS